MDQQPDQQPDEQPDEQLQPPRRQYTVLIVLTVALLGWGVYHAIGSFYGGFGKENLPVGFWAVMRSLMVLGCMGAFLAFWWFLMLTRRPPNSRTNRPRDTKND
jgi:hypothetical protein